MRRLAFLALGFAGAMLALTGVLWAYAGHFCVAAGVAFVLTALLSLRFQKLRIPAVILLGAVLAGAWLLVLQRCYYAPFYELDDRTVSGEVLLTEKPTSSDYGFQATGSLNWQGKQYPVLVYLKEDSPEPGNILEGSFRVRLTLPGGSKEDTYHPGNRVLALVTPKGNVQTLPGDAGSIRFFPGRLAERMKELLRSCVPEDAVPFAQSLLLGDTSGLDYETKTSLSVSGIRHIVAVSGLHVGVLCAGIWFLTGKRRFLTVLAGLPVLALFAAMVGFTPSVCRACLMAGLMMVSGAVRREYDGLTELSFAVLVLLFLNPFGVQGAGFQLSVLSVLGILLFKNALSRRFRQRFPGLYANRRLRWIPESLSVTLSAMSLSTPAAVYYFGVLSLVSPIANLLCLPLVSVCFYGLGLTCGLGSLYPPAGVLLGHLAALPIRLILWLARTLSRLPLAALYTASIFTVPFLVFFYLLILARLLTKRGKTGLYLAAALAGLSVCTVLSSLGPRLDECRLTVLDVGQGQCLLLQSRGRTLVVDCGGRSEEGAADAAAEMLLSQNIPGVQALALTHYDRDHSGGVRNLLTRVNAGSLILPGAPGALIPEASARPVTILSEPASMALGAGTVWFYPYYGANSAHENSMAILFETENCVILITGDWDAAGERALLEHVRIPHADILVVGHHGSKNAASPELLEAAAPGAAVISVGANNSYGHPSPQTLDRLREAGCAVYRTDQQGTIIFRR